MDKKNLMPSAAQPVNRSTTGQLPESLAELSEEALQLHGDAMLIDAAKSTSVLASNEDLCFGFCWMCSYDGDDAE